MTVDIAPRVVEFIIARANFERRVGGAEAGWAVLSEALAEEESRLGEGSGSEAYTVLLL